MVFYGMVPYILILLGGCLFFFSKIPNMFDSINCVDQFYWTWFDRGYDQVGSNKTDHAKFEIMWVWIKRQKGIIPSVGGSDNQHSFTIVASFFASLRDKQWR